VKKTPSKETDRKNRPLWRSTIPVDAYIMARAGMENQEISAALRVNNTTFSLWQRLHPELAYALQTARKKPKEGDETFEQYAYTQLPPKLQELWDKIDYWFDHANGYEKIRMLLDGQSLRVRQSLWLHAIISSNFDVSHACHMVGVNRAVLKQWEEDPDFVELLEELKFHKGNFYEKALNDLVVFRHPGAVVFANKTFNADRGFGEKLEVKGEIQHLHGFVISVDQLDLTLEEKLKLLEKVQAAKLLQAKPVTPVPVGA